jgi:alginate O-acetyltransferase complex protein AlgI
MGTASFELLGFGIAVALCYNLFKPVGWRQAVLLVANLIFLAKFSMYPRTWLPFAGFLLLGFVLLCLIQNHRIKFLMPVVLFTILIFIWLKKYTFLPQATFLRFPYMTIGLSYIFFRVLHLLIDARKGDLPDKVSFISYLNYTLNFVTLVTGPIQLYYGFAETHLAPERPPLTIFDVGFAARRIAIGFFKVEVLSLIFSGLQHHEIATLSAAQPFAQRVVTGALIAAIYPIFLYCNFSGYIDLVIGLAALMRFRLPENFNRPFSSDNFLNFWNRWHITLSSWFKTYFYNPLVMALMRRYPSKSVEPFLGVFGFFATFFLLGIWHGQNSVFAFYGVVLALGVSLNKLWQIKLTKALGRKRYNALSNHPVYNGFSRGLTYTYSSLGLVWFWSNWGQMGAFVRALGGPALVAAWILIFVVATVLLAVWETVRAWLLSITWKGDSVLTTRYVSTVFATAAMVVTAAVILLLNAPAPQIVYKTF